MGFAALYPSYAPSICDNAMTSPLPRFPINVVLPKVAMMDAGVAWLVRLLGQLQAGNDRSSVLRSGKRNRSMHS
jgi:hypothetical protein